MSPHQNDRTGPDMVVFTDPSSDVTHVTLVTPPFLRCHLTPGGCWPAFLSCLCVQRGRLSKLVSCIFSKLNFISSEKGTAHPALCTSRRRSPTSYLTLTPSTSWTNIASKYKFEVTFALSCFSLKAKLKKQGVQWTLLGRYSPAPISIKHLLDHGKASDAKVIHLILLSFTLSFFFRAVSVSWSVKSRRGWQGWSWSSGCSPPTCSSRRSAPRSSTTTSPASGSSSLCSSAFKEITTLPQNNHQNSIKILCCNALQWLWFLQIYNLDSFQRHGDLREGDRRCAGKVQRDSQCGEI